MAIAKRPVSNRADIDKFISGAGDKAVDPAGAPPKKAVPTKEPKREPVLIRIPPDLLDRIDEAAAKRGISRAAWLVSVASRALDEGGW
jgi:hypothetical protein